MVKLAGYRSGTRLLFAVYKMTVFCFLDKYVKETEHTLTNPECMKKKKKGVNLSGTTMVILSAFVAYLLLMIVIGVVYMKKTSSSEDYFWADVD